MTQNVSLLFRICILCSCNLADYFTVILHGQGNFLEICSLFLGVVAVFLTGDDTFTLLCLDNVLEACRPPPLGIFAIFLTRYAFHEMIPVVKVRVGHVLLS